MYERPKLGRPEGPAIEENLPHRPLYSGVLTNGTDHPHCAWLYVEWVEAPRSGGLVGNTCAAAGRCRPPRLRVVYTWNCDEFDPERAHHVRLLAC